MGKNGLFTEKVIQEMSWQNAFAVSKFCSENAKRLHHSAKLLQKENFIEQAFNNLFIACEEYYKAKNFETIASIKFRNGKLKVNKLKEFIQNFGIHKFKFNKAFEEGEMNIPNVSIKTREGFDDTNIQKDLQNDMKKTFEIIEKVNPFNTKNNSLYIGFDNQKKKVIIPQEIISTDLLDSMMRVCFYIQISCQVSPYDTPSGELGGIMEWEDY